MGISLWDWPLGGLLGSAFGDQPLGLTFVIVLCDWPLGFALRVGLGVDLGVALGVALGLALGLAFEVSLWD